VCPSGLAKGAESVLCVLVACLPVLSLVKMPSDEDLKTEIERLRAENAALKKPA